MAESITQNAHASSAKKVEKKLKVRLLLLVASCLLLGSCTASYCLDTRLFSDDDYIIDLNTNTSLSHNYYPYLSSKINHRSYYSSYTIDWERDTSKPCSNAFRIRGYIEQKKGKRDSIHYNKAILKDIRIIVNNKDTLSWTMTEGSSSAFDSISRYDKTKRTITAVYNYTPDSLPWSIPQSGLDSDWSADFTVCTEPVDIKKIRRLRVEMAFQVDDIVVVSVEKARRRFRLWFEPRQGFRWVGPEDVDIWGLWL